MSWLRSFCSYLVEERMGLFDVMLLSWILNAAIIEQDLASALITLIIGAVVAVVLKTIAGHYDHDRA